MEVDNDYFKEWFSEEQIIKRKIQLTFLYSIFKYKNNSIIFKGGTALDLFYNSGRFS